MRRSGLLQVSAAAISAALLSRAARADDSVVRIGTLQLDPAAEVYFAQDGGFFRQAGLAVNIQPFTAGAPALAALFGGSIDIALCDSVGVATAYSQGLPVTYLAPACVVTRTAQAASMVVLATSPINAAKDLNGKALGTNGLKNIVQVSASAWIDNNGGDAKTVRFVELPVPEMPGAVEEGRIDAALMAEPFLTNAQTGNKFRVISLVEHNLAPEFLWSGWVTTTSWAANHPNFVKRFIAAMNKAAKWSNANHALTAPILSRVSNVPLDVTLKMRRVYYGEKFDLANCQPVIDAAARYGAISARFPAGDVIDAEALR
jgi:NitT/TauT family transport system substrate-binding protein